MAAALLLAAAAPAAAAPSGAAGLAGRGRLQKTADGGLLALQLRTRFDELQPHHAVLQQRCGHQRAGKAAVLCRFIHIPWADPNPERQPPVAEYEQHAPANFALLVRQAGEQLTSTALLHLRGFPLFRETGTAAIIPMALEPSRLFLVASLCFWIPEEAGQ
jgi:hypothetical protein